tara:strand:- start:10920 stop:11336 length:417 start_codon:yes stop_codon:yes gene_type:complete
VCEGGQKDAVDQPLIDTLQNPYSLLPAWKFGAFFVGVFFLTKVATVHLGEQGIYPASAIAGLADASAVSLSAATMVNHGSLSVPAAGRAVLVAVAMNALAKWIMVLINGNRDLTFWLGGGFVTMTGTGAVLMRLLYTS